MTLRILRRSLCLAIAGLLASWAMAGAQTTSMINCSGTATGASSAVSFANGPPTQYVWLVNSASTGKLWFNPVGGAAAQNTAGSAPLESEGNSVTLPPVAALNVLNSAGSSPYTCGYR